MSAKHVSRPAKQTATSQPSSSRGFDKELAGLEALGEALKAGSGPDADQVEHLRRALAHRNNFIVAKPQSSLRMRSLLICWSVYLPTTASPIRPRLIRSAGPRTRSRRHWLNWDTEPKTLPARHHQLEPGVGRGV